MTNKTFKSVMIYTKIKLIYAQISVREKKNYKNMNWFEIGENEAVTLEPTVSYFFILYLYLQCFVLLVENRLICTLF